MIGRQEIVRISDLEGVHWSRISGGVRAPAPRPFLSGYVKCDQVLEGGLSHSCMHGEGPHRIKVCVVKKDNTKEVYAKVLALATSPKPP